MVRDKSPVLRGRIWDPLWEHEERWDEGFPGQEDVLDTGGHPALRMGTHKMWHWDRDTLLCKMECIGLGMGCIGINWGTAGLHGGAGLGQECLRMH